VSIEAHSQDSMLTLEVFDSGMGKAQSSGGGIGLANVRQRLQLLYGEGRSSLTADRQPDGRYRAQITIPEQE
jgi:sensor histidine kinase YesM